MRVRSSAHTPSPETTFPYQPSPSGGWAREAGRLRGTSAASFLAVQLSLDERTSQFSHM